MGYRRRIGLLLGFPLLSVLLALIIYRVSRPPTPLDTLALFLGGISGLLGCWHFRNTLGRVNLPPLSPKTTPSIFNRKATFIAVVGAIITVRIASNLLEPGLESFLGIMLTTASLLVIGYLTAYLIVKNPN
jgi:hypothetical protein